MTDPTSQAPPGSGHRSPPQRLFHFDPARLLLGLCVLLIAAGFVLRGAGELDVQLRYLAAALPVALVATAGVAIISYLVRRR